MLFSDIIDQMAGQDLVEWIGLITGIIYVVLATLERPSCWIFGIISSACIAYKSFLDYKLIADGVLQLFYIVIGFIGLIVWIKGHTPRGEKPIITQSLVLHVVCVSICGLLSWPVSEWLVAVAGARYGYVDTLLALLSVWATLLLVRKDLHNWIYWVIIDTVYVFLYWKSGGMLFALLFLVYSFISIWGLMKWRKSMTMPSTVK